MTRHGVQTDDQEVALRLAYLRAAAAAVPCPTCGAGLGEACLHGGAEGRAFVGPEAWKRESLRQDRLRFIHLARHHAWIHVASR